VKDTRLTFTQFLGAIVLGPAGIVRRHAAALWHAAKYGYGAYRAELDRTSPELQTGIERYWAAAENLSPFHPTVLAWMNRQTID